MLSGDQTDFAIAMGFAKRAGNAERMLQRTGSQVNQLVTAHRAALRRIEHLERELERERAARLAAEINAERRH
ncbi:hypothetical protein [Pelagibacterium halotolerans]|uniref:Uncharacterized protein n=1 Tax=Pelagibacterium halotolerans (strain DSM 22347 / JCM 15775 / CGMCC 1.7692 / B2) TaxID=1082931 RepID=G4RBJ5_PELHB|nr:hypothetical protein [Pelagibacterium halotolerans]AEQ52671.1 hypothetical protein KKY_2663 [Pelagibacterium halotolerans B2]QJR17625.1 hypothetical protein HKM20_03720 [Pelagibacterium halotolerans]SEA84214.1 hypothetical protein SAMN05428936_10967 [Pelagibacterium halotolerans]